eukprot:8967-Heterococcus_DN1.PRE.2
MSTALAHRVARPRLMLSLLSMRVSEHCECFTSQYHVAQTASKYLQQCEMCMPHSTTCAMRRRRRITVICRVKL